MVMASKIVFSSVSSLEVTWINCPPEIKLVDVLVAIKSSELISSVAFVLCVFVTLSFVYDTELELSDSL